MTPLLATASPPPTAGLVQVAYPAGDPDTVRATGSRLLADADALEQVAWRLGADLAAMCEDRTWCSPASAAYDTTSRAHTARVDQTSRVLRVAGLACTRFASALVDAQAAARVASVHAERLARQQDDLQSDWRRLTDRRATTVAMLTSPLQVGSLMADQPALVAEQQRLVARGAALAADVARTAARARDIERTTTAAAAELVATLSDLTRLTSASRAASAAARHDALVAAGELPAEDGSIGSRLRGVVTGMWSDVTDPIDLIVGLGGGHGDPLGHWRSLGAGLVDELTHPWQTVKDLLDASDLRQHDWGQWSGTVVPDGLLSAGSGGLFAVAKVLHGADMMVVARRTVDGLSRAAELDRLARTEALLAAVEGRASALVPVGGLRWHEQAGGHVLDRHVAMSVGALQHRLATEDIGAASTFANRLEAEVAISVTLQRKSAAIARWLGGRSVERAFFADLGRPVGVILHAGADGPVPGSVVKVVLHRSSTSPVGYFVVTSFPVA